MLISLSRNFIFIANLKTASTAIEAALSEFSEIKYTNTEWGKHRSLASVEANLEMLTGRRSLSEFFCFGVVRDPKDWLFSLYRSHRDAKFVGTNHSTGDMSFDGFLEAWCDSFPDMARPQTDRLRTLSGEIGANCIIDYSRLDEGLDIVAKQLNLPSIVLEKENISPKISCEGSFSDKIASKIASKYQIDFLTRETALMEVRSRQILNNLRKKPFRCKNTEQLPASILTPDDVIWAYRLLLGRDPETSDAIQTHLSTCESRDDLLQAFLHSPEFRDKNLLGQLGVERCAIAATT